MAGHDLDALDVSDFWRPNMLPLPIRGPTFSQGYSKYGAEWMGGVSRDLAQAHHEVCGHARGDHRSQGIQTNQLRPLGVDLLAWPERSPMQSEQAEK